MARHTPIKQAKTLRVQGSALVPVEVEGRYFENLFYEVVGEDLAGRADFFILPSFMTQTFSNLLTRFMSWIATIAEEFFIAAHFFNEVYEFELVFYVEVRQRLVEKERFSALNEHHGENARCLSPPLNSKTLRSALSESPCYRESLLQLKGRSFCRDKVPLRRVHEP